MRENYHSFNYWENVINANKTIRGHMFMKELPTEESIYFHTIIFGNKNGINNTWGYCPNIRSLIGYLQYSFLQEAFYKWIYGKEKLITKIPHLKVDKIVHEGEKLNKISKEVSGNMKDAYEYLNGLWGLTANKSEVELRRFVVDFNKKWIGDEKGFLYMKVFKTPEELGEFVISSTLLTNTEQELENIVGMTIDEWRDVCKFAISDCIKGAKFRTVLQKKLSGVY